jgi:putative ABC transport system substrate-binding protein
MRRRAFLRFVAGVGAIWPLHARAQQMQRVAILTPSQSQWQPRTLRDALSELGYSEGVNLSLDVFSAENQLDRLPKLAAEIIAKAPNVIVAVNNPAPERLLPRLPRSPSCPQSLPIP